MTPEEAQRKVRFWLNWPGLQDGSCPIPMRAIEVLAGLSLPGRDAGEPEDVAWAWLEKTFPEAHTNDRDYSADEMVDAFIAGRESLSPPISGDAGPWSSADEEALHERARDLLDTAGEEMLRIEPNASVWVTRNSALRAIIRLIEPDRRKSFGSTPEQGK